MSISGTNIQSFVDTNQLVRKISELTVSTSSLRIPFLSIHQKTVGKGEISNPHDWAQRSLSKSKVTLAAQYTAGSNVMTVAAGTTKSPVILFKGISEVGLADGSIIWRVEDFNSTKTSLVLKKIYGTDSTNIASGTVLFVTSYTQHGLDMQAANDGQTFSYDYNYISNKTLTYQVSKLLQGGYLASLKDKDYTIEDKRKMAGLRQLLELEYDFLASPRVQGASVSTGRGYSELSTDNGSRMGGFMSFLTAGGAQITDNAQKPPSLSQLLLDVKYLDSEGAFDEFGTTSPRDSSTPLCYLYCDRDMMFDWYRIMIQTATGERLTEGNKFGYSADMIHVGGVDIKPMISNGIGTGRYILEARPEHTECVFIRNREQTADTSGVIGDNQKVEEATTFTLKSYAPWQNVMRYNVGSLSS